MHRGPPAALRNSLMPSTARMAAGPRPKFEIWGLPLGPLAGRQGAGSCIMLNALISEKKSWLRPLQIQVGRLEKGHFVPPEVNSCLFHGGAVSRQSAGMADYRADFSALDGAFGGGPSLGAHLGGESAGPNS